MLNGVEVMSVAADVETWLAELTEVRPAARLRWSELYGEPVRSIEHLSVLMSFLDDDDFGYLEWETGQPAMSGQAMHVEGKWIIEVHDGSEGDFMQRVFRGGPSDYPPRADRETELHGFELFEPLAAAIVLWQWQHGLLPEGVSRTMNYLSPRERRRWGVGGA